MHDDVRAVGRESERDRRADSARRSGDERYPPLDPSARSCLDVCNHALVILTLWRLAGQKPRGVPISRHDSHLRIAY
jgi:hypothetical protein